MNRRKFTQQEIDFITTNYSDMSNADIALKVGRTVSSIHNFGHNNNLKKSKKYVAEMSRINMLKPDHSGKKYQFTKGHIPKNKGKKQIEYMSSQAIQRTISTRFHKGHTPANHKPLGYQRITKDGYIEVKVQEPNKFQLLHRKVWEENNGAIPKGFNVQFRDGNKTNCDLSNLYLISRSEQLLKENSMYARYPKEIQLAIQARGALNRQINKLKNQ